MAADAVPEPGDASIIAINQPAAAASTSKANLPTTSKPDDLTALTVDEVADLLRLNAVHVVEALERGELPGNRAVGQWRVLRASLLRWLDGNWKSE
jgi:excisionase family DNA binding protein